MEFPKLYRQTEDQKKRTEKRAVKKEKDVDSGYDRLDKIGKTADNKQQAYEKYQDLIGEDPEAAKALWEKKKLAATWERWDKKNEAIKKWRTELDDLLDLKKQLEADLPVIKEEFSPMKDQAEHPVTKKEFYKGRWNIRNSRFKLFQDIFTPPRFRMRPRKTGCYSRTPYDQIPLEHCVVNPEWIPNWFLEEYFGVDLPKDLTPFQKMQRKADAIPRVTDFAEQHITFLSSPTAYGGEEFNYRLLIVDDFNPQHDGKIFYPRYRGAAPEHKDRKIIQVYESAYEARRRTEYASRGYEDELRQIAAIETRIKTIHRKVGSIRADDPQKEDKKKEVREKLVKEAELIQHFTNYYKHIAYAILKKTMDLKDVRGVDNPSAACTRLLKFLRVFKERFPQIFKKSGFVEEDKNMLTMIIAQSEAVLEQYFDGFKEVCERLAKAKKATIFKDADERIGNQREYATKAILGDLDYLSDLSELNIRPFNLYGAKIQEKIKAIKDGIHNRDFEMTRQEAIKAFVVCKIFKVQEELEEVIREISLLPLETHIGVLLEKANRLHELVKAREVFSDIEVESYKAVYEELEKRIGELVESLEDYEKEKPTQEERQEIYQNMKKDLEEIDFPTILAELD